MVYVGIFLIASLFVGFSEVGYSRVIGRQHKWINCYIPLVLAACIVSTVAGLRASGIGVDVSTYAIPVFEVASSANSLAEAINSLFIEQGYAAFAYFASHVVDDVHFMHFVTSFAIVMLVLCAFLSYRKTANIVVAFLAFCFLYFATTLNIVRQSIAIAIVLYSSKYLFKEEYWKYLLGVAVAFFFHRSALVAIVFIFIHMILKKYSAGKMRIFAIVAMTTVLLAFLGNAVSLGVGLNIFPEQYAGYVGSAGNSSVVAQVIARLPLLVMGFLLYEPLNRFNPNNNTIFCFLIIDCILGCTSIFIGDASRISLFFGIWQCVYIAEIYKMCGSEMSKQSATLIRMILIIYLVLYWGYCVLYRNFGTTYPYVCDVFGFTLY